MIRINWITNVRNAISFISPYTWLGILKEISIQASHRKDLKAPPTIIWILHLLTPILILTLTLAIDDNHDNGSTSRLIGRLKTASVATLISPLSIGTILQIPEVNTFLPRMIAFKLFRVEADDDARLSLVQAIERDDAIRCGRFDVFFPPTHNNHHHHTRWRKNHIGNKRKAMIFIPGAFVDHTAYATVAARLAREGDMIVAVMSLEPFRLAAENLGADLHDVVRVMKCTADLWKRESHRRRQLEEVEEGQQLLPPEKGITHEKDKLDWCLVGHSSGGYTALKLAPQLDQYLKDKRESVAAIGNRKHQKSEAVKYRLQVVAWAVGLQYLTNLSENVDIDVLVVNGSNDNFVRLKTREARMKLRLNLPLTPRTKCVIVSGGTHNYFASYSAPEQFMESNGIPGVSRNQQHARVCSETLQFLFSR